MNKGSPWSAAHLIALLIKMSEKSIHHAETNAPCGAGLYNSHVSLLMNSLPISKDSRGDECGTGGRRN